MVTQEVFFIAEDHREPFPQIYSREERTGVRLPSARDRVCDLTERGNEYPACLVEVKIARIAFTPRKSFE